MRLLRKSVVTLMAAALLLTGCSTGGDRATSSASEATEAAGTFPQTVDTAFGEVTIDKAPQRVVALGWSDAETALALGVQPVGASDWLGFGGNGVGPWAADLYDESPEIIETMEPSYEAIAALKPDLILDVRGSGDQARYDRLSEIATTVGVPEGGQSYLTTMEQQVDMISTALGVPDKGDELLARVDKAFAEVKQAHPEWDGLTVSAVAKTSEGWGAYIEGDGRLKTLGKFGFTQNPAVAALPTAAGGFTASVSSENLDVLEADLIVAFPIFLESTAITDDPQWQQLTTVKEGRAIVIDGDLSNAFSSSSALGAIYTAENLAPLIDKARSSK